jgi:Ca-activated chloride channel homolog
MLWLMAVTLPLLGWFLWWAWRKKQRLVAEFIQPRLLGNLSSGVSSALQKLRMALLLAAVALLFVALARPQWGFAWEEATQRGLDIVVAIDTSRSMLAEDVPPNRLRRAKLAALDLLRFAGTDRLGLVAFAGSAFLQCPLTLDDEAFRQSVEALDTSIIPQGGTALSEAINAALGAFSQEEEANYKILVLFTDGEDHEAGVQEWLGKATAAGLKIFTIGVGTPNGEVLRQRDEKGRISYVKDDKGNVVKSRLNEKLLTEIATASGGFYLPLSGAKTMEVLYERGLAPLPKSEKETRFIQRFQDRYQWPLALAILCLILEIFVPDRKRTRRGELVPVPGQSELKKALAGFLLICSIAECGASSASAWRQLSEGQYEDARKEYERLLEKKPEDPRLHYNAGIAAYQAGKFPDAARHFSSALSAEDLELQERAFYNLGNSLFRLGESAPQPDQKIEAWESAIQQFANAVKLDPKDADAKFNHDLVKKKLEELQQQQQKQSSKNQKDKSDEKENDQNQDQQQQDSQQQQDQNKDDKKEQEQQPEEKSQSEQNQQQHEQQEQQEQKQEKEQSQDQQQGQEGEQKKPEQQQAQNSGKDQTGDSPDGDQTVPLGQMTPQQARQLLEAQKNEERAMIFVPPTSKNKNRVFKDW